MQLGRQRYLGTCILDINLYTYIYLHYMSRKGIRKERPMEKGSIRWLQSVSTEAHSAGVLCIWQVECQERNVDAGLLGCQGEVAE